MLTNSSVLGSYTWLVNLPSGTSFSLRITDGNGQVNYAAILTVQPSSDTSCLSTSASSAAASGASTSRASSTSAAGVSSSAINTASTLTLAAPSATVTAAGGPITGNVTQNNGSSVVGSGSYNFTCAQGQVTYGITTAVLQGVTLRRATQYFGNWAATAPGRVLTAAGTGVGATRTYAYGNVSFSETLRLNETNGISGSLHQQWNFTQVQAINLGGNLTVYNAFDDLTVYTNTTTNATNLQYFILGCFSNQAAGSAATAQYIQTAIANFTTGLNTVRRRSIEF